MSFKAALSASLLVSLLAGCGATTGPAAPSLAGDRTLSARAATAELAPQEHQTILYGAFFTAQVRKVEKAPENTWGKGGQLLTLNVVAGEDRWDMGLRGKLVVLFSPRAGQEKAIRVGDVVKGFANYPTVDLEKKTFINVPGKPSFVLDLEVLPRR